MTVVVDIGCMTYPGHPEDESMLTLIDRYRPTVYFGFDPHPAQNEYDGSAGRFTPQAATIVRRKAAWTYDGEIGLTIPPVVVNPLRSSVVLPVANVMVECFDLARWIQEMPYPNIVLKLDCEGAEYDLIPHLEETGAMERVQLLLVEFHGIERPPISVPWKEW